MKDLIWPLFDRLRNICCGLENDNCENAKIHESSICDGKKIRVDTADNELSKVDILIF